MKRDDVPQAPEDRAAVASRAVRREAMYFDTPGTHPGDAPRGRTPVFAWYHEAPRSAARDTVAVICPPVGYEYTRAHRSLRHLADRLAHSGVPALRFDYHGIGDSPGSDLDPDRLGAWESSIVAAVTQARALSGRERICLIGVRLGASLAARVAASVPIDLLVLWNACVRGKPYLRELQAIAASAEDTTSTIEGALESGGFVMTAQTREAIRKIDLLSLDFSARRILVASREDMPQDQGLAAQLASRGLDVEHLSLPGWSGMMADHAFTIVPDEALDRIAAWVAENGDVPNFPHARTAVRNTGNWVRPNLHESVHRFGEGNRLFGILARDDDRTDRPLVILFNAGAVHHVGPNRIYVELARGLAEAGVPCLRMDLETLGDSVLDDAWRENYPYPRTAMRDVADAFTFARRELGYERIIPAGLCSGAHMAFHAGLDPSHDLDEILLLNPLVYYWREGMSLDTSTRFEDMEQYARSVRDPERWKKLLRGGVKMRRLVHVMWSTAIGKVKSYWDALHEIAFPATGGTPLSRDLRKLGRLDRRVTFFIGERDQGLKILNAEARRAMRHGIKSGKIVVHSIPGGDHTFSRSKARGDLVRAVVEHCLRARMRPARSAAPWETGRRSGDAIPSR
jgi:alpha/beta superfamily hydrolase